MLASDVLGPLSSAIVRTVLEFWLRWEKDRGAPVDELLDEQVPDPLDRRRVRRRVESLRTIVQRRLSAEVGAELLNEPAAERIVDAVLEAYARANLSPADLRDANRDPTWLAALVRARASDAKRSVINAREKRFFDALLSETAFVLLATASALPPASPPYVIYQLLRDGDEFDSSLREVLYGLPATHAAAEGDADYRQSVVSALDHAEIVGFTLPAAMRTFPLTSTYTRPRVTVADIDMPIDWALADFPLLYVTGPAGSGKTALFCWLAVSCARQSLDGLLAGHNDLLPIYLPGRRIGEAVAESAESAMDFVARYARPSLPPTLTGSALAKRCAEGRVLFLVDGLDEFGDRSLDRLRHWLSTLLREYPRCRFVVSSRRTAIEATFLVDAGFTVATLNPLDSAGVMDLVTRWFGTVGPVLPERSRKVPPVRLAAQVVDVIRRNPQLRELTASPLMCALTCGVFLDRGETALAGSDLYAAFVDMLLERRDVERGLERDRLPMSTASIFLEDLAGHMLRLHRTELPTAHVVNRFEHVRATLSRRVPPSREILTALLVESGMLVEPESGRIRFLHRTFLEFLAAQFFLHNEDFALLVARAHEPVWRATLVMAVAQARHRQGDRLVSLLLERFARERLRRPVLAGVLQECVRGARRLDPDLLRRAEDAWQRTPGAAGEPWVVWLSTDDDEIVASLAGWLLADPALRRAGGHSVVTEGLDDEHPAPWGLRHRIALGTSYPIQAGDLVDAVVGWRASRPEQEPVELAIKVPDSSVLVRIASAEG